MSVSVPNDGFCLLLRFVGWYDAAEDFQRVGTVMLFYIWIYKLETLLKKGHLYILIGVHPLEIICFFEDLGHKLLKLLEIGFA